MVGDTEVSADEGACPEPKFVGFCAAEVAMPAIVAIPAI
jgi:hypothetical protein